MVKQLDTSNVKIGVEVTYNELCEMIGVEPSSNRTYEYNKIFRRYMDIERIDTHLFMVKEIYSDVYDNIEDSTNIYLREIAGYHVLTVKQEYKYGKLLQSQELW